MKLAAGNASALELSIGKFAQLIVQGCRSPGVGMAPEGQNDLSTQVFHLVRDLGDGPANRSVHDLQGRLTVHDPTPRE
jgi:hypothetical protein